ncbi:kelch-like protein [Elysia marginata]|uniref:Kelch-like protein n=1 Tax=Elysia marginata TaxID=1093978 RepID=A0AAV4GKB9_9GAST|nr:kelch-like protein [Elysia marginata]
MESVLQSQKQQMTTVDGAMFSPRLPRDILFVIGGSNFGFPLNLVEAFDCRTFSWSVICPYDFAPRSYHGMVALNEDIYVIGGFSGHVYLSSCCKLRAASLTWENVTPMNTKRCYVGAVTVKGYIFTVGGYDGVYRLNSAERFSTETNQWSFISPMNQQRSDAGVAVLEDKVYVCGGFNGMECIRSVELYDPNTDCWCALPSMPRGRSGLGLAAHNGRLYAVGGFDGVDSAVRLSVMESYDPETCQWTVLEPMFHPRSNLAVEVLEDLLYAIGGYCGDRTTSAVECYDFDTNTWFESGQLSHNRSALGACVVSGLSNTADILRRNGPERCALVQLQEY